MFIKPSALSKLIKGTFKSETLRIRTTQTSNIFGGLQWLIRIDREMLPNEIKGDLIKCCGELPAVGEQILVLKGGNQQEIPGMDIRDEDNAFYVKTDLTLPNRRLYQEPMHGRIAAAPIAIADNIASEFCEDSESGVTDPEVSRYTFTWSNSAMELQTLRLDTAEWATIVKHMEGVRLAREEIQET